MSIVWGGCRKICMPCNRKRLRRGKQKKGRGGEGLKSFLFSPNLS